MKLRSKRARRFRGIRGLLFAFMAAFVASTILISSARLVLAGPVTVKMVYWPGPESEAMAKVVDWWNKNRADATGVKVEMVLFGREGFWEKETTILAARSAEVDLIFTASYIVGKHAPYLDSLDEYFADPELSKGSDLSAFIPSGLDSLKAKGKLYGIPLDISNHFMYYRSDLIDRLLTDSDWGTKYKNLAKEYLGKELYPADPNNWSCEDWLATCIFFTKKYNPESPTTYGTALPAKNLIYNVMIWNNILWAFGGSWFKDGFVPDINSEAGLKALKVYVDLVKYEVTPPGSTTYEFPEVNEAFKTGKVATVLQWSAAYHMLVDPKESPLICEKTRIAPVPGVKLADGTATHATHVHALGVGLNSVSKHKKEAFKWMAFLASPEAMLMYAKYGGIPPVGIVLKSPKLAAEHVEYPVISKHVDAYGFVETTIPETTAILEVMSKHLSAAWALQVDPKEALDAANKEIYDLLKAAGYYK